MAQFNNPFKFHVTDGNYNYFSSNSEAECNAEIERLKKSDAETRAFYMQKYGYIPEGVDIPAGYYVSINRFN